MAAKSVNIQDIFLNQARKDNTPITVHLVNGFQIKGTVRGFDNFTVIVEGLGKQQMIYKHAISTITPAKPVQMTTLDAQAPAPQPSAPAAIEE